MSISRIAKIIKHDLYINLVNLLILFEVIFGLILLGVLYFSAIGAPYFKIYVFTNWIVFLFGIALASFAFKEFIDPAKTHFSIILPVTLSERVLSRILQLAIFYPIFIFIITYMGVMTGGLLAGLLFDYNFTNSAMFALWFPKGLIPYFIIFPIFFFGSAYFNNLSLFKTILLIGIFTLVIYLVALITWNILFFNQVSIFSFMLQDRYMFSPSTLNTGFNLLKDTSVASLFVIKYAMPVIFLVFTYFSLKEREIR